MPQKGSFTLAPVLLLLLVIGTTHVQSFDLGSVLGSVLGSSLKRVADNVHRSGPLELFGHNCEFTVTPKIKSWEVYYKANVWCPGWVPYRGQYDDSRSSSKSELLATQDLVRQLLAGEQITEQEAKVWLDQKI